MVPATKPCPPRPFNVAHGDEEQQRRVQEAHATIRRQQEQIGSLSHDNARLRNEAAVDPKIFLAAATDLEQDRVTQLTAALATYTVKVEAERRKLQDLENKTIICDAKIVEVRKAVTEAASGQRDATSETLRSVTVLEERLMIQQQRLNETISGNKCAHGAIDEEQKKFVALKDEHTRVDYHVKLLVADVSRLMEQISVEQEALHETNAEVAFINAQISKEQVLFDQEIEELTRMCEVEQKMHSISLHRSQPAKVECTDKQLVASFEVLAASLGVTTLSDMLRVLLKFQQENFLLFCRVNDLNDEITQTNVSTQAASDEITVIGSEGGARTTEEREFINSMSTNRDTLLNRLHTIHASDACRKRLLKDVKAALVRALKTIGYNPVLYKELKERKCEHRGERGIIPYFGILEDRFREIVLMYQAWKEEYGATVVGVDSQKEATKAMLGNEGHPDSLTSPFQAPLLLPSSLGDGNGEGSSSDSD